MGRNSKQGKKGFWGTIVITLLLGVIAFAFIFRFTDGLTNSFSVLDFAVIYKNEYYLGNASGLRLDRGDVLEIKQFEGNEKIEVKVYAIPSPSDIAFTFGDSRFTWNESVAPRDVTDIFDVEIKQSTTSENGKITVNGSVGNVLTHYSDGQAIEYEPFTLSGDYFRMVINCGTSGSLTLDFSVRVPVEGIVLDKNEVFFE